MNLASETSNVKRQFKPRLRNSEFGLGVPALSVSRFTFYVLPKP